MTTSSVGSQSDPIYSAGGLPTAAAARATGCMLIATDSITLDGKGKSGDGPVTYNVFTRN